ncbi:PilC/PilY family type IV pilus protein [Desulfobacter vibrioformis]|uniref:PilC/PilY family type IV pilus protein n=1 Tax=Desulfobacter vibrioformis TaxID=34031 RepID=UPI00054D778A|nr:PilC/PilY family type IV pilus protein [Desulfobacter vibrioformis]
MTTIHLPFPVSRSRQQAEGQIRAGRSLVPAALSILTLICFMMATLPLGAAQVSFNSSSWQWHDSVNDENSHKEITSDSAMTITAAGNDVWTGSDQYAAYYLEDVEGEFTAIVKIVSQENTDEWAKAGIMVRNAMDEDGSSSGYCMVSVTPGNGYAFQWDNNNNGMLDKYTNTGSSDPPCWLKLVKTKEGNDYWFEGFYSTDGTDWIPIESKAMGTAQNLQDVGLFVTSHDAGTPCTVQFENFEINPLPAETTYTIEASAGDNGTIDPIGEVEITENDEPQFTIIPDTGYEISQVSVDSSLVTPTDRTYTFDPVTANHTIKATFSQILYTVTATAGDHGSITPSGDKQVAYNGEITFDVVPDDGYAVGTVTVDNDSEAKLTNDQYTFSNVLEGHRISVSFVESEPPASPSGIPGCATNTSTNYSSGFDSGDFALTNTSVSDGKLVLDTGNNAIDPDNIVIPFTQEVIVTFLYEGAGYVSDFGYILKKDAVDGNGNFKGWNNIPENDKHPLFIKIYDDNETGDCCGGGNGILDTEYGNGSFPTTSEDDLASYDDGTRNPDGSVNTFVVDGDGRVTARDMKKSIGTIAGGTELVFFLTADKRWNTTDTNGVFFTKKDWNPDTYGACGSDTFNKTYRLGDSNTASDCVTAGGWLTQTAIDRMDTIFDVQLSGDYVLPVTYGQKYAHVIVGAPPDAPNKWILGWEDLTGGGDADHNDMVFQIERRTGGVASLESENAIVPEDDEAYFTAVTMTVYDNLPCSGTTEINYWLSIDDGDTWIEITEWDEIYETDNEKNTPGEDISDTWVPGTPQYTKRKVRVDFSEKGLSGRALRWKAEMFSELETCIPEILDVELDGTVATNGYFARAEPVIQTNVVYSGAYETPALSWTDKSLRGHLVASRRYDPKDTSNTDAVKLWDAGQVLTAQGPAARTIYYHCITVHAEEELWTGDGIKTEFSGTLEHSPVCALTVEITDQTEKFTDKHIDELSGSLGGSGTINRFTGQISVTFKSAPGADVPVKASYFYYVAQGTLEPFTPDNITNTTLGLNETHLIGKGYTYDFNGDGQYTEADGDWLVNWVRGYKDGSTTAKEWLLGPVDHSVPAVQIPPGTPWWYYGSAVTDEEKKAFDKFVKDNETRRTVVYVGSRDGMLHAFDGGKFRWGDNPVTSEEEENRGYFLWEGEGEDVAPNYGTGAELWAFIPANLVPRLKNNNLGEDDQAYVDASPTIADVKINDTWTTVLLCAQGNGGDTVTCLNVTDPDKPTFMWEFADPELYRSRSSAAVSQIGRIQVNGEPMWVAFFVSGKTDDPELYPSIYLVNIETGHLIERIYLNHDPDGTNRGKGGVASGQPAIVDSDGNGYIDRIYVGSDKGYLYKVIIPDDPDGYYYGFTNCVINTDFTDDDNNTVQESYRYQPIYASPAVTVQTHYDAHGEQQYNITIFFGTGDSPYYDEDIDTDNTRYHFYAYTDTAEKGICSTDTVSLDWYLKLDAGHRIYASAFSAAGNIYFGTSTAETEDPCESQGEDDNSGKVYIVDAEEGTVIKNIVVGNVRVSPLVDDEHLYVKTTDGSIVTLGGGRYNNAVIMGAEVNTSVRSWKEISN